MICGAVALRCSRGLSPMKKRAVLSVLPLPEPKKEPNAAMSGSLRRSSATLRCEHDQQGRGAATESSPGLAPGMFDDLHASPELQRPTRMNVAVQQVSGSCRRG